MDSTVIFAEPEFRSVFSAYFDSDLIDVENKEDILFFADTVVFYTLRRKVPAHVLASVLEYASSHWGPEVIGQFEEASNFPWSSEACYKDLLRSVVETMLAAARIGYEKGPQPT